MTKAYVIELISCGGVEAGNSAQFIQNPRISNKLKGQTFEHFQEIQFHPWD